MSSQNIHLALGTSSFLKYTTSWIYRQFVKFPSDQKLIVCSEIENPDIFSVEHLLKIERPSRLRIKIQNRFPRLTGNLSLNLGAQNVAKIESAFKKHQINLMHVHFGTYAIFFAPILKRLNIPMVITFHGHDITSSLERWPAYAKSFQSLIEQTKFAIVISEEMKERLLQLGCPESKIKVSYLGVPLDTFQYIERPKKEKTVFMHAGRIAAKKGVPDLVRSFAKAFANNEHAELIIVGEGEEMPQVKAAIAEFNLGDRVKLLGRQSDEELLAWRSYADVFVLNCRTDEHGTKEGLPIATLEAAACGLPAISTYHAGIPESIIDGVTGFLVNEFDNEAFAEAMIKMTDYNKRSEMSKASRKFMEDKFDLDKCNEVLFNIYKEAVA